MYFLYYLNNIYLNNNYINISNFNIIMKRDKYIMKLFYNFKILLILKY